MGLSRFYIGFIAISLCISGCGSGNDSSGAEVETQGDAAVITVNTDDNENQSIDSLLGDDGSASEDIDPDINSVAINSEGCLIQGLSVVTDATQQQCDALIAIYNATDGPNWKDGNTNWNTPTDPCEWYRVGCDENGVKALSMYAYNMSGALPQEFYELTNLQFVSLSLNNLSGAIPEEIGNLTRLTHLILNFTSISGELPKEIGNLTNLQTLGLAANQLTGSLPPEFGQLTNVSDLQLGGNHLTGPIPEEMGNMTALKLFNLSGNQLTGSVPTELGGLFRLESFTIRNNLLEGELPQSFGSFSNLRYFYADTNSFSGDLSWMDQLQTLEGVDLSNNGCFSASSLTLAALLDELSPAWDAGCL